MSLVVEADGAVVGAQQAGDDVEAGGLAGAVGAEQPDRLAAAHLQADVAQHVAALELLAEIVRGEPLRSRPPGCGCRDGALRAGAARRAARGLPSPRATRSAAAAGRGRRRRTILRREDRAHALRRLAAVGARHRGEHARAAADQIDLQPLAADHVVVLGQHHRAFEAELVAGDVVDPGVALRGLLGDDTKTLPSASIRRIELEAPAGGLLAVAVIVDPQLVRAQHQLALHRVDIAGEGGELLLLRDLELVGGDLDRQAGVVAQALRRGDRAQARQRERARRGRTSRRPSRAPWSGRPLRRPGRGGRVTLTRPSKRSSCPLSWISKRSAESVPVGPQPVDRLVADHPARPADRSARSGSRSDSRRWW